MVVDEKIFSTKIDGLMLRQIELSDCTERYVCWLNDAEVNQFLETKWSEQNMETVVKFVKEQRENTHSILWAIIFNGQHVGNIKIGPINSYHSHADISYFIGEKDAWGKGIATEVVGMVCEYGFKVLHLHKIEAGTYFDAVGSQKVLERNGFMREAVAREHIYFAGTFQDEYRYGKINPFEGACR